MKKILHIGTGGTISSADTGEGLAPKLTAGELLTYCPEIGSFCRVDCLQLFSLDSTNVRPAHWIKIAQTVQEHYADYDGFVVTHGTDTMAYSAAAVSYLVQNSPKPIVFTGAQKPMEEVGSDAVRNTTDAFRVAADDGSSGVSLVFSGSIITGTRARKTFSKSFAAFGSANFPEIGRVQDGEVIRYVPEEKPDEATFYNFLNPNVGLIKFVPGMRNDVLKYLIDQYDGLVVESFGVGGLPEYSDFYDQIKRGIELGKLIVMTTQVPNEGSHLSVYRVGAYLKNHFRILEAHDMTTEAALAKLMWILGETTDFDRAEAMFYRTVGHDILYKN